MEHMFSATRLAVNMSGSVFCSVMGKHLAAQVRTACMQGLTKQQSPTGW
jgi:hypothetical protein